MTETRWDAYKKGAFKIPANDTFGFERLDTDDGSVAFRWTVPDEFCNSAGNLQGGVMAAFADAVLGGLCASELPNDFYPALAEMKISFLCPAPVRTTITATGRVLKAGKRLIFAEAEITNEAGDILARITGTELPAPAS